MCGIIDIHSDILINNIGAKPIIYTKSFIKNNKIIQTKLSNNNTKPINDSIN